MINIVVPMAGQAKQFSERGYTFPKPLIEIGGSPMIEIVVRNLTPKTSHRFIFICRQEHVSGFALGDVLRLIAPDCKIVPSRSPTAGALCSVLLAGEHINPDEELLIVNADQYVDASIDDFLTFARKDEWDGCLLTFSSTHPKWSYARVERDRVIAVAEKRPISKHATAGIYYFRRGQDFLQAAEKTLLKSASLEGQFYVCPVYNEMILMGRRITIYPMNTGQMHSLGTPEDIERFIATPRFLNI
ncbi:MAG: glycosyltransferase family 2 protein [Elusimicrobia bacterium]|nr:glycosyltransferase family 2 protein [Elusimicrobiota bacterium]